MTVNFAGSYASYWVGWVESRPCGVEQHKCCSTYLCPADKGPAGQSVCELLAAASGMPLATILLASEQIVGGYAHIGV